MGKQKNYCLLFNDELDLMVLPKKSDCFNITNEEDGEYCDVCIEDQNYHCKILKTGNEKNLYLILSI